MSRADEPIHDLLADLAELPSGGRVVDLGCGDGPTLAAFGRRDGGAVLAGVDRDGGSVARAGQALRGHGGAVELVVGELGEALPFADGCADAVVSYNVLECLADPAGLLGEIARVLRPGGRAVLAHVDFDTLVFAGAPDALDRRVCHAYCDDLPRWRDRSDGRMGRRLPGLVAASPLALVRTDLHTVHATRLHGHAAARAEEVRETVGAAAREGRAGRDGVSGEEAAEWYAALAAADAVGGFLFAETAVVVTARR